VTFDGMKKRVDNVADFCNKLKHIQSYIFLEAIQIWY
jgi:hypothetical protein